MSKEFWENRWMNKNIGWDLGEVSPPIKHYIDQVSDKTLNILIPGVGNAYEAEYLLNDGFVNVFIVEISESAIKSFKTRCPHFPVEHIIHSNFFEIEGQYDLIIEQTFFCALNPSYREIYVEQMTKLLTVGGKLVGVLFNTDFAKGPPFGGSKSEYLDLFSDSFIIQMNECYNSVKPRQDKELFIILTKK